MIEHPGHEQTVVLTRGLPGSGKTSFAKKVIASSPPCWRHISRDDLRTMLLGNTLPSDAVDVDGIVGKGKWTPRRERQVIQARDAMLRFFLRDGACVVVDETFLNPKALAAVRRIVETEFPKVKIEVKDFTDIDIDVCVKRDIHRGDRAVGAGVIRRMAADFLRDPAPLKVPNVPEAIICDLDGTLALFHRTANPYDREWSQDILNEPVARILERFHQQNVRVIIFSGRKDTARPETEKWLKDHAVPYDGLLMRPAASSVKDATLKRGWYEDTIKGYYNVLFVLDDRDQVVDLWRRLGLTCLQVDYGAF